MVSGAVSMVSMTSIVLLQNWEHCGGYFWIKHHCIELVLSVTVADSPIKCCQGMPLLPSLGLFGFSYCTPS
ncbi:hypothetical protein EMCRGX_G013050 [Ephydatia muelleri]